MSQFDEPINPSDLGRGPMIMGLTWAFTTVTITTVSLRAYVRSRLTKTHSLEDWLMYVALVSIAWCLSLAVVYIG